MRGRVLGYDDASGQGVISGDNGQRFPFTRGDLQGGARLAIAGQDVDFEVSHNNSATNIFVLRSNSFTGEPNKLVAALLAFFLGLFGAHKFYLGRIGLGITYLLIGTIGWITIIGPPILGIICLIEAIIFITKSDEEFHQQYVVEKRAMF